MPHILRTGSPSAPSESVPGRYASAAARSGELPGRSPPQGKIPAGRQSAVPSESAVHPLAPHGLPTGLKHGTVTVEGTEVTTFRRDGSYGDNRRPDYVEFTRSLDAGIFHSRLFFTKNRHSINRI